ncbi:MAG: translation elongation factor-like protein [Deltaproteobacteria bacterium]|nr:translation elongation factor-like protein [Deltaproteobacteria bacterium]
MPEEELGIISHWFGHLSVAAIKVTSGVLRVGDTIHIKGHTTDVTIKVQTIQLNHQDVQEAPVGSDVGIKVAEHVRQHDKVYKVT